jgi:hypothetical protein
MVDLIELLQGLIHDPNSNMWLAMILVLLGAVVPFIIGIFFPTTPPPAV